MPTAAEYEAWIRQLDWQGLRVLWEAIKRRDTPGWHSGMAFEYLVLRAFELDGARVQWPYTVEIDGEVVEQIDGAVHWHALACLVESKDTRDQIEIGPIAKMRDQLLRRHAGVIGLIFSHAGFTKPAILLARYISPHAILLWTGAEVEHAVRTGRIGDFLEYKYRFCVETGEPDASILRGDTPP